MALGCLAMSPLLVLVAVAVMAAVAVAGSVGFSSWTPAQGASLSAAALPAGGGVPAGCASLCEVDPAGPHAVFPWVPAGGFPDGYPYSQCTYGAAFNFDPFGPGPGGGVVQNLGNGGDWYASARRLGLATLPADALPPVGAAVSYAGFPGDVGAGHVAVVIADDAGGRGYWVYEMNVIRVNQGTGITDVRHMTFPGDWLVGSVPAPQATPAAGG